MNKLDLEHTIKENNLLLEMRNMYFYPHFYHQNDRFCIKSKYINSFLIYLIYN